MDELLRGVGRAEGEGFGSCGYEVWREVERRGEDGSVLNEGSGGKKTGEKRCMEKEKDEEEGGYVPEAVPKRLG
jgi:hypothetical protein